MLINVYRIIHCTFSDILHFYYLPHLDFAKGLEKTLILILNFLLPLFHQILKCVSTFPIHLCSHFLVSNSFGVMILSLLKHGDTVLLAIFLHFAIS